MSYVLPKMQRRSSSMVLPPTDPTSPIIPEQPELTRGVTSDLLEEGHNAIRRKDYATASEKLTVAYEHLVEKNPDKAKEIESILASLSNLQVTDTAKDLDKRGSPSPDKRSCLTGAEKEILKRSSRIEGRLFLPWTESDARVERTVGQDMFVDPDGFLSLADKQQKVFAEWTRTPSQCKRDQKFLCTDLSAGNIKQTLVGDCSFVSALAVCCHWENRFPGRKLVTHQIYPQDAQCRPVMNQFGKYVVKLLVNGMWRKVVVDDFLPVDKRNSILSSYSKNGDYWVSIIEKAFLKVHGGYQFPGSISSFDTYTLTGWPPEEMELETTPQANLWNILTMGKERGQCICCAGTRSFTPEEEEKCGLASRHAYAILEVGEFEGYKLLLLKNPWSSKRWRGKFSPEDSVHWTPTLKKQLKYDDLTSDVDRGLFWIDIDSLCAHFAHLSLNWAPDMFAYQVDKHFALPLSSETEPYSRGGNEQLSMAIEYGKVPAILWFVISQHTPNFTDDAKMDYLTAHIYKADRPYRRMFHTQPLVNGVYTNAAHSSVKFQPEPKDGKYFTLVPSRWCSHQPKKPMLDFTIRIFSTVPLQVEPIPFRMKNLQRVAGEWKGQSAGGSCESPNVGKNPQYGIKFLDTMRPSNLRCTLSTDTHIHAAVHIVSSSMKRVNGIGSGNCLLNCPHWTGRFCVAEMFDLTHDVQVIACTRNPGQEARFTIDFECNTAIEVVTL